ncbi:cation efflux family protein [Capsaspora owczarzaki ATCC 30864]|uniref:Cation efflux family protein n=1 Tax=Capsaspora owczarzaki (strain ATCC 30864) TaxID=595528 RepID=A0A0D2WT32_CAPO3|nr:cation efflux family protein [Capsaspora owczarzaki ATCC 30864]KJE94718.1 cation efflux family protein [Capsaspora owczarzaki ATCC 30864]|eukprot:XP_004347000.1 cation efflux family protein [Capsaspora owczarzaki ATCC 30864]
MRPTSKPSKAKAKAAAAAALGEHTESHSNNNNDDSDDGHGHSHKHSSKKSKKKKSDKDKDEQHGHGHSHHHHHHEAVNDSSSAHGHSHDHDGLGGAGAGAGAGSDPHLHSYSSSALERVKCDVEAKARPPSTTPSTLAYTKATGGNHIGINAGPDGNGGGDDRDDDPSTALLGAQRAGGAQSASQREAQVAKRKLLIAAGLCAFFMVGEVVGGAISGSLAIMTDAAHMLSDFAGFMISLFALWLAQRKATDTFSFGFHRAEIIGAIVSVLLIWALTGVLVYEAVLRVIDTPEVDGEIMFITALCGLAVNILMGLTLHQGHGHSHGGGGAHVAPVDAEKGSGGSEAHGHSHNINVRAAYIHVLGDLIQSIGVLIASIMIWVNPDLKLADPICTFVFSVLVLFTTVGILRDSVHVLMEGVPKGIDYKHIKNSIEAIAGVERAHDLHIWSLTVGKPAIAVHVSINGPRWASRAACDTCTTPPPLDPHELLLNIQNVLCGRYGIHHTTVQIEDLSKEQPAHCTYDAAQTDEICNHH